MDGRKEGRKEGRKGGRVSGWMDDESISAWTFNEFLEYNTGPACLLSPGAPSPRISYC